MKTKNFGKPLSRLITMVAICMLSFNAMAYDFSYTYQGKTLYYDITSSNTVKVTVYSYSSNNYVSGDVVIPSSVTINGTTYSVTSIGGNAFSDCSGLTSVTIPNSVTSIGNDAFYYCSSLTSVTIPNSVTSIGERAFENCSSLTSVTIPNSVSSIGDWAFAWCSSLTSVTIPNSVTSIAEYAFRNCSSLNSVTIPNSVTSIGSEAFENCSSLNSVTIPNSVTSIGSEAFENCSSLTSVTIPNSVTSIAWSAFENCSSLTSVTIPNRVTSIGNRAFGSCSSLTSLNFNAINCSDFSSNSDYHPFSSCPIATINIGDSVQRIPAYFAYDNDSLTSVTIPNSVTRIENYAFSYCINLTSLNFNAIHCNDFSYNSNYHPFRSCPITTINIGDSVQRIPAYFAYDNDSLTSVTIGNSVTSIGSYAFASCSSLTSLNFNAIHCNDFSSYSGYHPFSYCPIATINIGDSVQRIPAYFAYDNDSLTSVTIGNSVTSIGSYAFASCSSLTSVTLPNNSTIHSTAFMYAGAKTTIDSVTYCSDTLTVGNYTFVCTGFLTFYLNGNAYFPNNNAQVYDCNESKSGDLIIPSTISYNGTTYSVTSIGSEAFMDCSNLTSVTIPNSVTSIDHGVFWGCSSLTSVTIPESVTSIGNRAFYDCSRLTTLNFNAVNCSDFASGNGHQFYSCPISTINIGDSVQRIPAYFAYNLDSLTFVTIPNSVTYIGAWAFRGCSSLTSVTIPNSVTSIGNSAFCSCSNLTSVNIPESATSIKDSTFLGCSSLTSVTIPNSITYIGNGAFSGCSSLTSVTIPESVTSIGYEAFCGCSSLTTLNFNAINCNDLASGNGHQFYSCPLVNINFGDSVQRIPANFAENKSDLISISIPDNITEIGNRAFQGCSGLIAVTIGNGVNNIYSNSFRGCTNLTYLTVGSGVETIEDLAFIDCNMLSHITSKATTPPEIASSNVFPYPNECSLTVPCGSLGAYTDQMNRWYLLFNPRIDEDIVFAFSVSANDDAFGIVSNEALSCSVRKITAIPFDGYEFVSWNDGNTSNPRTINITSDTSFVAVFATIGSSALQEVESTREFVLYPNPTRDFVIIEFEALQERSLLRIIDLGGRVVKTFDIATGTETLRLDLRDLPSGVYTLMIGNTTKKLIIE